MIEAIKIVSQLEKGTDSMSFFGGFRCATIRRGTWESEDGKGTCMRIDGINFPPDKIIFKKGKEAVNGSPCKQVLLEMPDGFLSIGTDASVFVLGTKGQTIEAIY